MVPVLARLLLHAAAAALPLTALAVAPWPYSSDNRGFLSSFPLMSVSLVAAQLAALWGWRAISHARSLGAAVWWGVVMGLMTHCLAGLLLGIVQLIQAHGAAGSVFVLIGVMALYILISLFLVGWFTVPAAAAVAALVYRAQRYRSGAAAC